MTRRRSLYARPVIVRGQQCAEAPLDPGGATKQLPARRYLALEGGLLSSPSLHGLSSAAGAVRRNTVGRPSVRSLGVVARRSDAGRAFVTLSRPRPASGVQCPVSGASDQCPRLPVHGTGVQCPVRASERPGVRCPASGVCALPRALCPAEVRSWSAARAGSHMAGMAGVGVVARCVHDRLVVCLSWEPGARSWCRRWWASGGVGLDLTVVVGGGWAVASSTAWPTRTGRVHARIVRWREPVRSEACLRQAGRRAAGESLGRSCRVEPNIKKPIGHIPLAKQN